MLPSIDCHGHALDSNSSVQNPSLLNQALAWVVRRMAKSLDPLTLRNTPFVTQNIDPERGSGD